MFYPIYLGILTYTYISLKITAKILDTIIFMNNTKVDILDKYIEIYRNDSIYEI